MQLDLTIPVLPFLLFISERCVVCGVLVYTHQTLMQSMEIFIPQISLSGEI